MKAGRKREFDEEKVLDVAMVVFWKNGYGNTKLLELTDEMGINKPSLYNSFGNKEELFIKAITRYEENVLLPTFEILNNQEESMQLRLTKFLNKSIHNFNHLYSDYGCMLVNSVSELRSRDIPDKAAKVVVNIASNNMTILDNFFLEGIETGAISGESANTHTLYLLSMLSGFAVMIRGNTLDHVEGLIDMTVKSICKE